MSMSFLLLCLLLVPGLWGNTGPLITKSFGETLQREVSWQVAAYEENIFKDWSVDDAQSFLGLRALRGPKAQTDFLLTSLVASEGPTASNLPDDYDFRKAFPQCVHPVRDQGKCGSCWAMGSVESLGDRLCRGGINVMLSAQEIVSCVKKAKGCGGGYLDNAFDYFEDEGVVTEQCFPYTSQNGNEAECVHECTNKSEPYIKHYCKPNSSHYLGFDIEKLKTELYNNGPIAASFLVYRDFFYYKGGVYYHKSGDFAGIHAIEAVGFGKEDNMPFWIIANSWGADWGEAGYFRIKIDDCGINKGMIACIPILK